MATQGTLDRATGIGPTSTGVRTTVPRRVAPGGAQERNGSTYAELANTIKGMGLMERRRGWYLVRSLILLAGYVGGFVALFSLGSSPWQLLVAVFFAVLFTQTAFLAHDGAHKQIFASGKRNEWVSRIFGNLLVGLSYGWWMNKHSKHHANPNKVGKDGDIVPGAIVFTQEDAAKHTGWRAAIMARQHWFFFPILTLAGVDLHINAVKAVVGREPVKARGLEAALLAIRLIGFPILVLLAAGPLMGLAFMGVQLAIFGVYMGGSFAPNHKGMAIIPKDMSIDFLRRQTLTSRNISGGPLVATGMGGLNFQIEHHLFPSMPSVNLSRARPVVRAFCAAEGIAYTETTLVGSYRIVLRYLQKVGLKYADPFDCPLATQLR
ncbi:MULTISPECIES: acyl-CoA desaturase [unclassified Microbacterium]|uniref:fatty acid desaturase family protein n=1 Tax=unclassified Microbacterium TaxID=2609290 RepID=UPI0018E1E7C6|nr:MULTISPECIES: acyl-CoA desaturase [unclassified Microbacterium]